MTEDEMVGWSRPVGFLLRNLLRALKRFPWGLHSIQSLSRVRLFATPWTAARQASLSITNSWGSLKLMSIESVMPSNHLILCCPLLLLPSIFPNIRVFSNESALRIRWPKYWISRPCRKRRPSAREDGGDFLQPHGL